MSFLPDDYKVPSKADGYMKLQQGENRIRIMTQPILGWEWWVDDGERRAPRRVRQYQDIPASEAEHAKHFWAMIVYSYEAKQFQILELTQKSIQRTIQSLSRDEDWGEPTGYDIVITKTGEKMETEYEVKPKPAKPLDEEIVQAFKKVSINLDALYEGSDPFATAEADEPLPNDDYAPSEGEGEAEAMAQAEAEAQAERDAEEEGEWLASQAAEAEALAENR